ncbi:MAG: DegT/DnrJ/EryC1/StrS family aminotransferase [Leptospiraceae bacterium]|nr:DegT/DnrJ/EryC1/StrS family aminotransferase [Leptospiraceae bacterium]MDW7975306.1 DegT/DnrJ/EryC1/StrS family aminotransferase [Leptospiraceae bacterium]
MLRKKERKEILSFFKPDITDLEIQAVEKVLRSHWLTTGKVTEEFENKLKEYCQSENAIAVSSGTAALHLSLKALGLQQGDAVFLPAFTFTATAEVVIKCQAYPIFLDVDRNSYLLTSEIIQEYIDRYCDFQNQTLIHLPTKTRIRGILCVHYGGRVCDLTSLNQLAKKYHLFLGEDAAHAFGSTYKQKPIGTQSDFCVFSFYATKNITTGEGGAVITNHHEVAQKIRRMRLHGFDVETYRRKNFYYDIIEEGFKYNIPDILSAIGIVQLSRNHEMKEKRKYIHQRYQEAFRNLPNIRLNPEDEGSSYHLYTLEVPKRNDFIEKMKSLGIQTSVHFPPLYRMSYYRKKFSYNEKGFPNTEEIYHHIVSLPIYSKMTEEDIQDVIDAVKIALENL